jgi:hypothetical protein
LSVGPSFAKIPDKVRWSSMSKPRRTFPAVSEDWLSVVIGLLVVLLAALGGLAKVPWPLFGWFK